MSEQDIRSLITSRQRKKVSPRDSTLITGKSEESKDSLDKEIQIHSEISASEIFIEQKMGKRLAITLEQSIRSEFLSICDQSEITPETFIEAAIIFLKKEPHTLEKICNDAQDRLVQRKKAGVKRRSLTMMKKYGSD
jgi:hypothetical protein